MRQLVASFIVWLLPPVIASLLIFLSVRPSDITGVTILVLIVAAIPISAYILYRVDLHQNDGYVSVWGFR